MESSNILATPADWTRLPGAQFETRTCSAVIGNGSGRYAVEGRGFGRHTVASFTCPACGTPRKLRVSSRCNGRAQLPPGGFVCGAVLIR